MAKWYIPASQRIGRLTIIDPANKTGVALGREHKLLPIVIDFDLMWVDVDPHNSNRERGPEMVDTDNPSPNNQRNWIASYWGPDLKAAAKKVDEYLEENAAKYGATRERPKRPKQVVLSEEDAEAFSEFKKQRGEPAVIADDEDAARPGSGYVGPRAKQGPIKVGR